MKSHVGTLSRFLWLPVPWSQTRPWLVGEATPECLGLRSDSPAGRKCGAPTTGFLSPSELLVLLQLPQLPRLARTLPEELPQSELESEQDFSTLFPGFWK